MQELVDAEAAESGGRNKPQDDRTDLSLSKHDEELPAAALAPECTKHTFETLRQQAENELHSGASSDRQSEAVLSQNPPYILASFSFHLHLTKVMSA